MKALREIASNACLLQKKKVETTREEGSFALFLLDLLLFFVALQEIVVRPYSCLNNSFARCSRLCIAAKLSR